MSKVIIVTGASRGIGLAIAQSLLSSSHRVVLTARSADKLAEVKAAHPGRVEYVAGDLTDAEVWHRTLGQTSQDHGQWFTGGDSWLKWLY